MIAIALALLQTSVPVPACVPDAALPPALAGWKTPAVALAPGGAVTIDTVDATQAGAAKPTRTGETGFAITSAGTYTITLDGGGWIDVLPAGGGEAVKSVAHAHNPACTTIRKLVAFQLAPGNYRLALKGLSKPRIEVGLFAGELTGFGKRD